MLHCHSRIDAGAVQFGSNVQKYFPVKEYYWGNRYCPVLKNTSSLAFSKYHSDLKESTGFAAAARKD